MVASRGCPYRCRFCCNYTGTVLVKGVAVRSHEKVVQELRYLEEDFGAREVFFTDDIFLLKKSEMLAFAKRMWRVGCGCVGSARGADSIDRELAEALAEANYRRIYFGVESGSDEILARADKRITTSQLLEGVGCANRTGIRVKTGWGLYGLPGAMAEQKKVNRVHAAHETAVKIQMHQLIPFPGNALLPKAGRVGPASESVTRRILRLLLRGLGPMFPLTTCRPRN